MTDKINPYTLILSGHYDRDPGLDQYLMALVHAEKGQINEWRCTTSHASGQQRGDQHTWGGLIPPVHHVPGLKKWEIDLNPIYLPQNKGVRGYFYRILPYLVKTSKGTERGDFGVHLDANAPGSLGCPVMDKHNFDDWQKSMKEVKNQGFTTVPLYPLYS